MSVIESQNSVGNFLKMYVSEIRVKQIRVNQGLSVFQINFQFTQRRHYHRVGTCFLQGVRSKLKGQRTDMGSWGLFTMLRRLTKVTTKLNSSFEIQLEDTALQRKQVPIRTGLLCKKWQKIPNQDAGLGNRGPMAARNDKRLILND